MHSHHVHSLLHHLHTCTHTNSGIALKDMVAVDTQARDFTNTGSTGINMVKYRKLSTILSGTRRQQLTAPAIQPEMDHLRIIRVSHMTRHTHMRTRALTHMQTWALTHTNTHIQTYALIQTHTHITLAMVVT